MLNTQGNTDCCTRQQHDKRRDQSALLCPKSPRLRFSLLPCFPFRSAFHFGLIFLLFIIGLIGYHPDTRISLYVGFAWIVVLLIGWMFKRRHDRQLAENQ